MTESASLPADPDPPPLPYQVTTLSIEDGLDIAMWRTPGPWAVQDGLEAPRDDEGYWAVRDANDVLVGYCCFGEAARPPGMPGDPVKLDVALGMSPALTGRHLSREFATTVVGRAKQVAEGRTVRCVIASWNTVGRRTAESAGFTLRGVHEVRGRTTVTQYLVYEI